MPDPFLRQLTTLCHTERTASKWVIVPSQSLGWTLGERLLLATEGWVNLRFVTPFQLALESAAPSLLAAGLNPSPENLGPCLIQSLVLKQPRMDYFGPLILQPGMAEALWRTLTEFRLAGLPAAQLKKLPKSKKRDELTTLFKSYETYLETHQLADRATVLKQPLEFCPTAENDWILTYPYTVWSPLEQRLLQSLPGQHLTPQASALKPPRRFAPRQPVEAKPETPELFYAARREEEISEVLRRLLTEGTPLDQVEVAALAEDLPLLADRLQAAGLPATFEDGLPIALSRPGQALDGLLDWVEKEMPAFHLRELFLGGLLSAGPQSAQLLEQAQITWGRSTYHERLTELAAYAESRATPDSPWRRQQAERARALAAWMAHLFKRLPAPDAQGQIDFGRWLEGLQSLLASDIPAQGGAERLLTRALEELKLLAGGRWPLAQSLRLIRQHVQSLAWNAGRPRPGALHVTSLERLGLSGRPHLFVLGLEEGRRTAVATEDCVLDDKERQELHPGLARSSDRVEEQLFAIHERLATVQGKLTFSYAACDRAGDQEQLPSWWFFQAARARAPELQSHDKLVDWLGPPVAPRPRTVRAGPLTPAEAARRSSEFTSYDGYVPSAAGLWESLPLSASRLQALASCPFQFFLEKGLGLTPEALRLPDPDRWLDAATRGSVLHEVFAAYYRELRSKSWQPDRSRDLRFLRQLLESQLAQVRKVLPPPSRSVEKAETEDLRSDLERFLTLELQRPERTPIGCEVPFGMDLDSPESLAHPEPILLDLGEGRTLKLRGQIDRLDLLEDGYGVVDYKTGRQLSARRGAVYERGRLLQHALYAVAAEQLLQQPILESAYYFPSAGAVREWVPYGPPDRAGLVRVLNLVTEPLRSGAFVHTHETGKDCRYCDFRGACGAHRDEDTQAKLEDPKLAARRQLLEEA